MSGKATKGKGGAKGINADFKRRKQKVGKKKLAPANVTNTSFKWATLNVARPDVAAEEAQGTAERRQASLRDLLSTSRHHNVTSRKESVAALRSLLEGDPALLAHNLGDVMAAVADRIVDAEPSVRLALQDLLRAVLTGAPPSALQPFLPLVVAHLGAALSKLQTSVRLDALALTADLLGALPSLADGLLADLGGALVSVLEPQLHTLVSSSFLAGMVPRAYALGTGAAAVVAAVNAKGGTSVAATTVAAAASAAAVAKATAAAVTARRRKLTSIEARVGIVFVLRKLLLRGDDARSGGDGPRDDEGSAGDDSDEEDGAEGGARLVESDLPASALPSAPAAATGAGDACPEVAWTAAAASLGGAASIAVPAAGTWPSHAHVRAALTADIATLDWTAPLGSLAAAAGAGAAPAATTAIRPTGSGAGVDVARLPPPLAQEALMQLLQLWLECAPSEAHAAGTSGLHRLALVAHTIRLVLQACPSLSPAALPPLDAAACFASLTVPDGNLLKALRAALDELAAARSPAAAAERRLAVTRLLTRALHSLVWGVFPVVPSLGGPSSAAGGARFRAAVALLNTRLVQLMAVLLPPAAGVQQAAAVLAACTAAAGGRHGGAKTAGAGGDAAPVGSNQFALLAPGPRPAAAPAPAPATTQPAPAKGGKAQQQQQQQQQHQQLASKKRKRDEPAAPEAPPPTAPQPQPAVSLPQSQVSMLRKGLADVVKLTGALLAHVARQLAAALPPSAGSGGAPSTSSSSSSSAASSSPPPHDETAVLLLPCTLHLLQGALLGHAVSPTTAAATTSSAVGGEAPPSFPRLLEAFSSVYTTASPRSAVKARCLSFVLQLLSAAPGSGGGSSGAVTAVPTATATAWLTSFPRLLWVLGTSDAATTGAVLALLLEEARRAPPMSARSAVLADVARQCAPLLYTTRGARGGGGGAGVGAGSSSGSQQQQKQEGVLGPFASWPPHLQAGLLAFLRQAAAAAGGGSAVATSALRRALAVVARLPSTPLSLASQLVETGCALAAGTPDVGADAGAADGSGVPPAGRLPRPAAEHVAFLLALATGRAVTVSTLTTGPQLVVAPPSEADAGVVAATFDSVGRHASAAPPLRRASASSSSSSGLSWQLGALCDGDDGAYDRVLRVAAAATAGLLPLLGAAQPAAVAACVDDVLRLLAGGSGDSAVASGAGGSPVPAPREAALVVALCVTLIGRLRAALPPRLGALLAASLAALHEPAAAAVAAAARTQGGMQLAGAAPRAQPTLAPSVAALLLPPLDRAGGLALLASGSGGEQQPSTAASSVALPTVFTLLLRSPGHAPLLALLRDVPPPDAPRAPGWAGLLATLLRSPAFAPVWRDDAVRPALAALRDAAVATPAARARFQPVLDAAVALLG